MIHTMLAARSHFSLGESTLTLEKLVEEGQRVGATAIALVDTMSVSGMIDFTNRCAKAEIKPIIGCRLRLVDDPAWRKTKEDKKTPPDFYLTWYVLSEKGLKALFRLLTLANSEDRFYNVAKLGFDDFFAALDTVSADDVAIAFSDVYSAIAHASASQIARDTVARLTRSNVFATLTPVATPYFDTLNARAMAIADELELPLIVTRPVCYPKGGADVQEIHQAVLRNTPITEIWHWSNVARDWHAMTPAELAAECKAAATRLKEQRGLDQAPGVWTQALKNTERLADMVAYRWEKAPISLPVMAEDENMAVILECKKGWSKRFGSQVFGHCPSPEDLRDIYKPRLAYELKVLRDLKFAGYFLLVQDVVMAAKSKGIRVGPGRGSVGGSLVAYLMGITDVDPIRFNLLFERFINPERNDLPDADLDFMSARRHEVIDYLREKYGDARVAGISNFTVLKGASALRDVSRMVGLPEREYACSKLVPKLHGQPIGLLEAVRPKLEDGEPNPTYVPDIAKFAEKYEPFWEAMVELEGTMRSLGRHAAGVVVGGCDLVERAVIERRSGEPTINWDKRIVEDQGLVKMDVLGLETLDIIDLALEYVRKRHGRRLDIMGIPLDDENVLAHFALGRTTGIFQFESGGMKRLLKDLGADGGLTFEDITAATALYRPGPMDSGMMESYVRRKQGLEDVDYEHPKMAESLATTYGVMVYQEQVMQISRDLAGFSMAEADKLRKAMGKKDPKLMAEYRDKFVDGCVAAGTFDADAAGALFDKIAAFAGYGFNRSHSVEYTLISYQAMWLKVNYPVEYVAACLSLVKEEKLPGLVADAEAMGIEILPPDINLSTDQFEILTDTKLLIPFNRIKGISSNTAAAIMAAREAGPFKDAADLEARVERRKCNVRHRDLLDRVGAFASVDPSALPARHPDRVPDQKELIPGLINATVVVKRHMTITPAVKTALSDLVNEYMTATPARVQPCLGKAAKFMVISDAPTVGEEKSGQFAFGRDFDYCSTALSEAGLARADAYWTGFIKEAKKKVLPEDVEVFLPYIARELEILRPPVVLLLGAEVARHFIKDLKGPIVEHAGKVVYDKERDCNFVIGFKPAMIHFDGDKQEVLNALFAQIAEMI